MDAATHNLLFRACAVVQRYDRDGSATVTMGAWPHILKDLALQEDCGEARTLKDHMEVAGDGLITYNPLLEALGAIPPPQLDNPSAAETNNVHSPLVQRVPPLDLQEPLEATGLDPVEHEDFETFWSKRASSIQQLYRLWDCNQLTNESFAHRLQTVLGSYVPISDEDSEFHKLTNQHRFARNMKFHELMSALRRDARRSGFGGQGSPTNSVYTASMAPTPRESDLLMQFAGRPTSLQMNRGSRKHYAAPSELDDTSDLPRDALQSVRGSLCWPEVPEENYVNSHKLTSGRQKLSGGYAGVDPLSKPPSAQCKVRRAQAPFAQDQQEADANLVSRPPLVPDNNFWNRTGPVQQKSDNASKLFDTGSMYGTQSEISVADSQREMFTMRNRGGHGNILTWGNDSRSITPAKQRERKQLAVDAKGISPSQAMTMGTFHATCRA